MAYFTKGYIEFFQSLIANNNREWFHANKKVYEKEVKEPFVNLIGALVEELEGDWEHAPGAAKDYMMRIYRDVRFSKDKSPYKTHMAAHISQYGRKEMGRPGLFFHANHEGIEIYSGLYKVEKEPLQKLRSAIAADVPAFRKTLEDKNFKKYFGEVLGAKNKRLPPEFKDVALEEPLIANKQFYYKSKLDSEWLLKDSLAKEMIKRYRAAAKINAFLDKVIA